ncbi:MAG: hypothetical protein AUJ85_00470 [Elusimicrobia bacterium CG1_02_37_114]|nr:MAG: hypothetical protein AUJ85_00470 [Elusimicrobia bacterium CG1_02_37_114]PIV52863.1 MAG: chromosome partitioning protein ParA [Elusimicrobia bacterium CG02_land_8_20_14_3_00_37_13]PIZ13246.1 MAG: chromosome partitioning protein ParA [Elusimicrobia bacterium CG_4_10_14_0_8_um_filter_37_32]
MGKIISVANQKGGVGKTTTAINTAVSMSSYCQSVLIIDFDPQSNTTSGFGFDKNESKENIYKSMVGEIPVEEIIKPTEVDWVDIIPSNIDLIGAEVELVNMESREIMLKNIINPLRDSYDFIFIDCPPSLGLLTVNALVASDSILIPIQCEYYALEGMAQLLRTINRIRQNFNKDLALEGVALTMYDSRLNLSDQVVSEMRKFFGDKVYKTVIPRNVRLAEAPSFGKPALLYDKTSRGTLAYIELAKELLEKNGGGNEKSSR